MFRIGIAGGTGCKVPFCLGCIGFNVPLGCIGCNVPCAGKVTVLGCICLGRTVETNNIEKRNLNYFFIFMNAQ